MPTLAELPYRMPTMEDRSRGGLPVQPNVLDRIFGSVVTGLASLPRRAIESSQNYMATGQYDPEPVIEAATTGMTAGMPLAVRSAVGSAGGKLTRPQRPSDLTMDYASRIRRAKEMGYHTDMRLAHGTAPEKDFQAFSQGRQGASTGTSTARLGVWTEVLPKGARDAPISDFFANLAATKTGAPPLTKSLLHRADKPATLTLKGDESFDQISATIAQAWDDGFEFHIDAQL